jgi:ABC-type branched-subunit amino acid transport system substrate-binding protein
MQNDPYGRSGLAGVRAALAAEKLPLAALASYPRNIPFETSMAEQVQALRGTQAVVLVGAYAQCAAFIRDARAAGYQGWFGAISFVGADQLLALLGKQPGDLTRRLAHSEVVPCWSDSGLKVVADYAQAMDADAAAKAPGDGSYTPASRSFGSLEGYIDARLFTEIAKEAGPALTRTAFQQAAAKAKVDLGGLEFSFDPEMKAVGGRAFLTVVRGGRWASAERLLP